MHTRKIEAQLQPHDAPPYHMGNWPPRPGFACRTSFYFSLSKDVRSAICRAVASGCFTACAVLSLWVCPASSTYARQSKHVARHSAAAWFVVVARLYGCFGGHIDPLSPLSRSLFFLCMCAARRLLCFLLCSASVRWHTVSTPSGSNSCQHMYANPRPHRAHRTVDCCVVSPALIASRDTQHDPK